MTSAFEGATRGLEQLLGSGAAERIVRTEVRDDATLELTVEDGASARWFRWSGGELTELRPSDEERVPAARALAALCATGGAELLAWRPGRRMVVRVLARDGAHVVKAHRRGRAELAAARHDALRAAAPAGFRLPRVLRCDPGLETIAFESLAGAPPRADDLGCFQRVGERLRALQASAAPEALPAHDRARELAELDRHARRHALATGALPDGWGDVRAALAAAASEVPRALVLAHRDLHEGQLLVGAGAVGVLDWDLACRAEPELDVANLAVHLRLAGWLRRAGVTPGGAEGAVAALRAGHGELDERAERFHVAATALRLVLVHGLRPRARPALRALLDLARESAAELCRA